MYKRQSLRSLVLNSLLGGAGALVVFFIISLFLSRLALKPVEEAWIQQRQFVADASHELKTPLTVILANAGIVEGHPDETVASQHKWISYIQEEAQRMKGLVDVYKRQPGGCGGGVPQACYPAEGPCLG